MKRERRWAWVVISAVIGLAASVDEQLAGLVGDTRAAGCFLYLGVLLGWAWYRLYPRELSARLAGTAAVLFVVGVLLVIGGGTVDEGRLSPSDVTPVGVLVGLVLTERWREEASTSLSSHDTMRDLR
jgi:peptidoglycan/LPS O-acetylase OafA/YrhL